MAADLTSLPGVRLVPRTQVPPDAVGIMPTAAVVPDPVVVLAPDLDTADRAMPALAGDPHRGRWPTDVRFAAPPHAVIGAGSALPAEVRRALPTIHSLPEVPTAVPDGVDAIVTTEFRRGDFCGVAVRVADTSVWVLARPFDDAVALDLAATLLGREWTDVWPLAVAGPVELVVFGAHLRGGPLAHQLTDLGARWAGEITTAPRYRMTVVPSSPTKPAVSRVAEGATGAALYGQRWLMSAAALGRFLVALPPPMQLGKVECADGSWRTGFGCDASAAAGVDVTAYGSWPAAVAAGAV